MSNKKVGIQTGKKVFVGLSGGIDSAVAACLLKREGYEVTGVHMRYWVENGEGNPQKKAENKCCTIDGMTRAIFIARKLGIPLLILNYEKEFKKEVVDYYIHASEKTLTPNPCVECNRQIKFGLFLKKVKALGGDYLATGHYARIVKSKKGYTLHKAVDAKKDQSYFLYTLTSEKLKSILFPLGGMLKSKVRTFAREFGIEEINEQKESQDLCFLPGKTPESFLRKYMEKRIADGPIITSKGRRLGTHCGLPFYTIGQRKGIGIGGIKDMPHLQNNPWYVTGFRNSENSLVVGHDPDLYTKKTKARNLTFVEGKPVNKSMKVMAKIRYGAIAQPAMLKVSGTGAEITFDEPQRAVTPGQSIVFYLGGKVLGGGIIAR